MFAALAMLPGILAATAYVLAHVFAWRPEARLRPATWTTTDPMVVRAVRLGRPVAPHAPRSFGTRLAAEGLRAPDLSGPTVVDAEAPLRGRAQCAGARPSVPPVITVRPLPRRLVGQ